MIHDELIRQSVPNMGFFHLLVDHGVDDADTAVYAEGQRHLLVHAVEVGVINLVDQLPDADDSGLLSYRETKEVPGDI